MEATQCTTLSLSSHEKKGRKEGRKMLLLLLLRSRLMWFAACVHGARPERRRPRPMAFGVGGERAWLVDTEDAKAVSDADAD